MSLHEFKNQRGENATYHNNDQLISSKSRHRHSVYSKTEKFIVKTYPVKPRL